jgi:hypothetical protein
LAPLVGAAGPGLVGSPTDEQGSLREEEDMTMDRRAGRRQLVVVAATSLIGVAVILGIYFAVPTTGSILGPVLCALIFITLVAVELRAVVRNPRPVSRGAIAMARVVPVFIVLFAWTYVAMSANDPHTFTEPLSRSGALYFTITVLSTVGFGDITPVTDAARLTVSIQMICDLVVLGILVKLIVGVAKHARARQAPTGGVGGTGSG